MQILELKFKPSNITDALKTSLFGKYLIISYTVQIIICFYFSNPNIVCHLLFPKSFYQVLTPDAGFCLFVIIALVLVTFDIANQSCSVERSTL